MREGQVRLLDPSEDEVWDRFVEQHPLGWFYHRSGWRRFLEKTFPHLKSCYLVLDEGPPGAPAFRAALPLFEVQSWLTGARLVSLPFATLSDPLVSSEEDFEVLLDYATQRLARHRLGYIELRTHQASFPARSSRLGVAKCYRNQFLRLEGSPEELMSHFHRSCVRQRILKAEHSGLVVREGRELGDVGRFFRLHQLTRRRVRLPPQPYPFFRNLWEAFSDGENMQLLVAEKDGLVVGGVIAFKYKDRVSIEFSAADYAYHRLSPNHLLFWEVIKTGFAEERTILDFGRTAISSKHLLEFKQRWGSEAVDLPCYYYPPAKADAFRTRGHTPAYHAAQFAASHVPFWAFQWLGDMCYKHMA